MSLANEQGSPWLAVMHAVQEHIRLRLSEGLLSHLSRVVESQDISTAGYFELAEPEIERAFVILGPALVVDFMQRNPKLLDARRLEVWAKNYESEGGLRNND